MTRRARLARDELNPYIAVTDTTLNIVLVMVFFIAALTAVGRVSWNEIRYKDAQQVFQDAVRQLIPAEQRPSVNVGKNDPPGTQRWVFRDSTLFAPGTAKLTDQGKAVLEQFAQALRQNTDTWRRIRIEGHTLPTPVNSSDRWEDATDRAAAVARYLVEKGRIAPYYLATSGRGGQDPIRGLNVNDTRHARIELVLEYARQSAQQGTRP